MNQKDYARILSYNFLTLPYHVRIRIVRELGLVAGKTPMNAMDFFAKCFRKAKTDKKLEYLWDETFKETANAQQLMGDNPYRITAMDKPADEDRSFEAFEENFKITTATMMRTAERTGEVQMAHFSTNGWKLLAGCKGRIRIENIEVTITPLKKNPA